MLMTVHAYAHADLVASGEDDEVRRRHHHWAASTAAALVQALDADNSDGWQERFDLIAGDLRLALSTPTADPTDPTGFVLALALARLTYARQFQLESREHFHTAVERAPDAASAIEALRLAAGAAFAEMRGEASFDLLREASARASESGNTRTAAITLADASALAGRCPALFSTPLTHEEIVALIDEATAVVSPGDLEVDAHIALAWAWNGVRGQATSTPERSAKAVKLARQLDDPILISSALDAAASSAAVEGKQKESFRRTAERLRLLERLPRLDPRTGGEIADTFHMACESAVGAGDLESALVSARRIYEDVTHQGLPHFAASHLMTPLVLRGAFDEALALTTEVRGGWERSGRPVSGWMAPAFFSAAFAHRVRCDQDAYRKWWELGMSVQVGKGAASCGIYFSRRGALHEGAIDETVASPADLPDYVSFYDAYAHAVTAEIAVVVGAPDAEEQLVEAQRRYRDENDFVAAQLLRAAGRLKGDVTLLGNAVTAWEGIGARFERACTLLLLSERREEGLSELAALRCSVPASF
jgi:hypothetical protein